MFNRILVAVDGSKTADRGLKAAIDLASDQHATLYILHVIDDLSVVPPTDGGYIPAEYIDTMIASLRETGRKILARAAQAAVDRGLEAHTFLVESLGRSVAQTILLQARKHKAELIVLGTHGRRGLRRVLLGSDAENVLREARVPVLLVRSPETTKHRVKDARTRAAAPAGRRGRGKNQLAERALSIAVPVA